MTDDLDVIVVGAGFAGLYMLHKARQCGLRALVLEAGSGVGGTWYWNRYPGARCDVESMEYSYSFDEDLQQEWEWTERYAAQPEILATSNHVRRPVRPPATTSDFDTRVTAATFDEDTARWTVRTEAGRRARRRRSSSWPPAACRPPTSRTSRASTRSQGQTFHTGAVAP